MKPTKTIMVEIPGFLYEELKNQDVDIDEVVNLALQKYLNNKNKIEEELKKGYEEMSELNLGLANMCLGADNDALFITEQYLTECE